MKKRIEEMNIFTRDQKEDGWTKELARLQWLNFTSDIDLQLKRYVKGTRMTMLQAFSEAAERCRLVQAGEGV